MNSIETVCGPVAVDKLGFTLMHEHVIASNAGIPENYPQMYRRDYIDFLTKDLAALKQNQIDTIVDATPYDLGRDPKRLKPLSEATGVNIICCTGFFFQLNPSYGKWTPEQIARLQIDDLTKGMAGTDIKAGMIKAVMDAEGPTPGRRLLHHAAGIASKETGAPIFLHSNPLFETGRYQLALLKEAGADVRRIKLDHMLETTDMDYIQWAYDQGVWLGCERLPRVVAPGDAYGTGTDARIRTLKAMIDAGMADRMILSHDFSGITPIFDTLKPHERDAFDEQIPGRWLFIKDCVFPRLVEMGVDSDVLYRMNTVNPRRFLEGC